MSRPSARQVSRAGQRLCLRLAIAAWLTWCLAGCVSSTSHTRALTPRPDQQRWFDERRVIEQVVVLNHDAALASRRQLMVDRYADLLRQVYTHVSMGGEDVDAGIRALNAVRRVHSQARGKRALWNDALAAARLPGARASAGRLPIPADYR